MQAHKQAEKELRTHRDHLDELVQERTAQLTTTNEHLRQEIGERQRAEQELFHLRNYLANIIDSMPSVLIGVDKEGLVTQWNGEAQRATRISVAKAMGQPLIQTFPRLAGEMKRVREAIETRTVQTDTKRAWMENGETRYEDITVYPLIENGVEGAVIRVDDVTEQVRLEELMVQNEKLLSVGGLAAGMAHEINNPLAGIMQTASVMNDRLTNLDIPANQRAAQEANTSIEAIRAFMEARGIPRMLEAINSSGKRAAEIIDNMLSFAQKSQTAVSSYQVADLLDKTLELAATDFDLKKQYDFKTVKIVRDYKPNLPLVPCEGAKIQQVLLNILRNGSQAMQEANTKNPTFVLRVWFEEDHKFVRIEIEDNGPGMDEAISKRVFEPFFTTKPVGMGTGLGLSVSYFIITENHGGQMDVFSEPGRGTTFVVRLPVERKRHLL